MAHFGPFLAEKPNFTPDPDWRFDQPPRRLLFFQKWKANFIFENLQKVSSNAHFLEHKQSLKWSKVIKESLYPQKVGPAQEGCGPRQKVSIIATF